MKRKWLVQAVLPPVPGLPFKPFVIARRWTRRGAEKERESMAATHHYLFPHSEVYYEVARDEPAAG